MTDRKSQQGTAPPGSARAKPKPVSKPAQKPKPHPRSKLDAKVDIDHLFQALGDATRRAMLDRLTYGPQSVSALAEPLGVTLTAVAQHLQVLEECSLVHTEKLGRVRTCRIEPAGFDALEQWIADHRTIWEKRLDRLGALFEETDEDG